MVLSHHANLFAQLHVLHPLKIARQYFDRHCFKARMPILFRLKLNVATLALALHTK